MTARRTSGFTLIEMLTVIVIIGIMLVLTIPAVTTLMKSAGVSTVSRHVSNTLGLARQLAITQRVYARVVFPYAVTGSSQEMWYRTYAVMTNRDNSAGAALNWGYVTKWEYLPVGVVFVKNSAVVGGLDSGALKAENLPFPSTGDPVRSLKFIEFAPTGVASDTATLTYQEGFMDASGTIQTITSIANAATNVIDSLVGRIQLNRS